MSTLEALGLSRSFGALKAVDGVDLRIQRGEVYGLLGPNGAGKTTTLRMLATLLRPDRGSVVVDGIDALREPVRARSRLAWVPAEAGLPPRLTALESVTLFGRIQGVDQAPVRAQALLEELGAGPWTGRECGDLSTGMRRRVVLARALIHDPALLLLDEPTDGLDVQGRKDVLGLVRRLAEQGRAVVLSSHIMGEVQEVCDRAGVIRGGRKVREGTVEEALATLLDGQ